MPKQEENTDRDENTTRFPRVSRNAIIIVMAVLLLQSLLYISSTFHKIDPQPRRKSEDIDTSMYEYTLNVLDRPKSKNLVVFNALGKINNLILVEHARRNIFKPDEWDCLAFMFAKEDRIPKNNTHLMTLQNELQCVIPRTPGIFWGDFLQFMVPVFTNHFDYIALVLDDIFMPIQGPYAVNATKLIERMETYHIDAIQPGIVGDTHNYIQHSKKSKMTNCIAEVPAIETYTQIFTRKAWECFYSMLDYDGSRGWCYDVCFKPTCPDLKLAIDFSMKGWHMDRRTTILPSKFIRGTNVTEWSPEPKIKSEGYQTTEPFAVCHRLSNCFSLGEAFQQKEWHLIHCPS